MYEYYKDIFRQDGSTDLTVNNSQGYLDSETEI